MQNARRRLDAGEGGIRDAGTVCHVDVWSVGGELCEAAGYCGRLRREGRDGTPSGPDNALWTLERRDVEHRFDWASEEDTIKEASVDSLKSAALRSLRLISVKDPPYPHLDRLRGDQRLAVLLRPLPETGSGRISWDTPNDRETGYYEGSDPVRRDAAINENSETCANDWMCQTWYRFQQTGADVVGS